jgi:hypothetical protein
MKLKPGFDDELQPKGQPSAWSIRSIAWLMIVVADCGLAIAVIAGAGKHNNANRYFPARVQRPAQFPQAKALVVQPSDPFMVIPPAELDAKMVVAAPRGIDEAMVFNPYTGERQAGSYTPAPGGALAPSPVDPRGQVPENGYRPEWYPPTQPR